MASVRVLAIGETTFPFHDFDEISPMFEEALGDAVELTLTTDRDDLTDLGEYDVLLDYLTDSTLTDDQRDGLLSFVRGGGGYVGVHCASDLMSTAPDDPEDVLDTREEPFPELREMIGGHFLTHPDQGEFEVRIVDHEHPITANVDDFTVFDEPYQVECDDDVRVLAQMDHPDLDEYPVAWTKSFGEGRVFYLSLGHTEDVFQTEGFRSLLHNGIDWAAGDA
jgi:hypothetical protein